MIPLSLSFPSTSEKNSYRNCLSSSSSIPTPYLPYVDEKIWVKCARKRNYLERYEKTGDYVALTGSEMDVWKPPPSTPPASSSSSSSSSPSSVWHMPLGLPPQPPSQPQPRRPFATPFARPALPRPTALHPNTANIAGIGHLARPLMGGQILIKRPYMPPNRKKSVASILPTTPMTTSPSKVGVVEKEIFTEDIRRVLIQWLKDHKHHPYATEGEREIAWTEQCASI